MDDNAHLTEVLFEFRRIGSIMRVSAIDPRTSVEVTVMAPADGFEEASKQVALRKLLYVLGNRARRPASGNLR